MAQVGRVTDQAAPSLVALVPARGGSTRVPGKNTRRLGGHPLIAYTIASARAAGVCQSVVVSTDDPQTAEIARYYGADVPFMRPAAMAGSGSPDIDWVAYTLEHLAAAGRSYDCVALLRPTSPFRAAETIRRAWERFLAAPGVDSLRAVERVRQHPGKMWVVRGDRLIPLLPFGPRAQPWHSSQLQSLPEVYVQNASLEIAWCRVPLEQRTIAGETVVPFFTDEAEGFDINDAWDWELAETIVADGRWALPDVEPMPYRPDSASA